MARSADWILHMGITPKNDATRGRTDNPVRLPYVTAPDRDRGERSSFYLDEQIYDDRRTMQAWENFLGCGWEAGARTPVRRLIHDSWSRSASGGIDANGREAPVLGDRGELERLTLANAELLSAARLPFATIGRMLDGTGAMLVLADQDGVMIEAVGDRKILHDGHDINLVIGGKWNETAVGTNGIGTALWTGEPVVVHAAEHFCAGIKSWTCAGAPIRDPFDGSIIGVVDLSGHPSIFKPHNIALVMAAAREIEKILEDLRKEERTHLLEAFINLAPSYHSSDGLLILNARGRIVYSRNVSKRVLDEVALSPFEPGEGLPQLDLDRIDKACATTASDRDLKMGDLHVNRLALANGRRGVALVFPSAERDRRTAPLAAPARLSSANVGAIVGRSPALLAAIDQALSVASAPVTTSLLIEGETGVGKELFARLVHERGPATAKQAFVALNCGAVTRDLFGSELFGHAAGAYTGATREGKPGVFEQADKGTLALDEIGEMPLEIQPFLLRVLEERVVRRLGEARERPVSVRLVASTNRNLRAESEAGRFRLDLYYRISAVSIRVPALRDRIEDVPLLVDHFSRRYAAAAGCDPLDFDDAALERLTAYDWPGNVRELRNLVDRLHVLAKHRRVGVSDLPVEMLARGPRGAASATEPAGLEMAPVGGVSLADAERAALCQALGAEGGNLSRVARRLGISRPTLYRKLDQYGISRQFV